MTLASVSGSAAAAGTPSVVGVGRTEPFVLADGRGVPPTISRSRRSGTGVVDAVMITPPRSALEAAIAPQAMSGSGVVVLVDVWAIAQDDAQTFVGRGAVGLALPFADGALPPTEVFAVDIVGAVSEHRARCVVAIKVSFGAARPGEAAAVPMGTVSDLGVVTSSDAAAYVARDLMDLTARGDGGITAQDAARDARIGGALQHAAAATAGGFDVVLPTGAGAVPAQPMAPAATSAAAEPPIGSRRVSGSGVEVRVGSRRGSVAEKGASEAKATASDGKGAGSEAKGPATEAKSTVSDSKPPTDEAKKPTTDPKGSATEAKTSAPPSKAVPVPMASSTAADGPAEPSKAPSTGAPNRPGSASASGLSRQGSTGVGIRGRGAGGPGASVVGGGPSAAKPQPLDDEV